MNLRNARCNDKNTLSLFCTCFVLVLNAGFIYIYILCYILFKYIKIKQSRNRPGVAQRVQEV
jgi:hypothetical protein